MINKRNILLLLLLSIIAIATISSVNANDLNSTSLQTNTEEINLETINGEINTENSINDANILEEAETEEKLSDNPKSLSELNSLINGNDNSTITLEYDYAYDANSDESFKNGIQISRTLTLDGGNHFINGSSIAKGFNVTASNVILKNIKFYDLGLAENPSYNGGAISSLGDLNTIVRDSEFINCKAKNGGAVSNLTACINCIFIGNKAENGGATYNGHFANCSFESNNATLNGGAYYSDENIDFDIVNSTFIGNGAANNGGAFYHSTPNLTNLVNCTFKDNTASQGNGTYYGKSVLSIYINNTNFETIFNKATLATEDVLNISYPNKGNMTLSLSYDTNYFGSYSFKDMNITINITKNSTYFRTEYGLSDSLWIIDLGLGQYEAKFSLAEPFQNYMNSHSTILNVKKTATEIQAPKTLEFYYGEGKLLAKLINNVTNEPMAECDINLTIYINGQSLNLTNKTNESGIVEFDLSTLADTGKGYLNYYGNDTFQESKAEIGTIKVKRYSTHIKAEDLTFIYGEEGILNARLTPENETGIPNLNLRLEIGNLINETLQTNENGEVQFNLTDKLPIGTYNAKIYFDMYDKYLKTETSINITVSKIPTEIMASDISCIFNDGTNLIASLKDKYGNKLKNETIRLLVSGQIFNQTSDENGEVIFAVSKLATKTYQATIVFEGNELNAPSSKDINIIVNKIIIPVETVISGGLSTYYNLAKDLIIKLNDKGNTPVKNAKLTVNFNGKNYVLTTDSNGQAKLRISNLNPKTYIAKVSFDGNENYLASSYNAKVIVKKAPLKLNAKNKAYKAKTKVKKYTVTLKTNIGKAMKNTKLSIKFKHKTYYAKTNKKGKATFKINKLNKKGKYNAYIKFKGSKYYQAFNKHVKITVK